MMANMYHYLIQLSYVGSNYLGWQTQLSGGAVQDKLQEALKTILRVQIRIKGASRTDSGVHAREQYASFSIARRLDTHKLFGSLCGVLPTDIAITNIWQTDRRIDVINESYGKAYVYRIWNHRAQHPFLAPFVWHLKTQTLVEDKIQEGLCLFQGKHNFSAYAAKDGSAKTFERTLYECKLRKLGALYEIWIVGDGFLKQMIRNIVGTLTDYSKGKISSHEILDSFEHGQRARTGLCAPAAGLTLHRIFYDKLPQIRELQSEVADQAVISL